MSWSFFPIYEYRDLRAAHLGEKCSLTSLPDQPVEPIHIESRHYFHNEIMPTDTGYKNIIPHNIQSLNQTNAHSPTSCASAKTAHVTFLNLLSFEKSTCSSL